MTNDAYDLYEKKKQAAEARAAADAARRAGVGVDPKDKLQVWREKLQAQRDAQAPLLEVFNAAASEWRKAVADGKRKKADIDAEISAKRLVMQEAKTVAILAGIKV